jgi:hypothetical protein
VRMRRAAGHGVHRSHSISCKVAATQGDRVASAPSRLGGGPSSCPHAARHGLLPSVSLTRPSPRAIRLLSGAAPLAPFSAGHGVLRSFSPNVPVVRAMTA